MKAVILAAGIASRLRPLTDTTPKCLLKIGERCLLERAFDALIQNGFDEFIIVTGYRQQQIVDFLQARYPVQNITFIYNDRYESTNNIYSLWLTRPYTDGEEILLLDSDIVFDPQIVEKLLDSDKADILALNRHELGEEEIKVIVDDAQKVVEISKVCSISDAIGESIGIEKMSVEYTKALFQELEIMITTEGLDNIFYERAFERYGHHRVLLGRTGHCRGLSTGTKTDSSKSLLIKIQIEMANYDIRPLQLRILKNLLAVDKVCKEHNLRYYIMAGTMLGAVRHKGFIPWDDDLDIGMPRADYDLLMANAKEWLPKPYEAVCAENDKEYPLPFAKVQDADTTLIERMHLKYLGGVYIDIFPLDGVPESRMAQRMHFAKYEFYKRVLYLIHRDPYKHGKGPSSWIPLLCRKLFTLTGAQESIRKVMKKYDFDQSALVCDYDDGMKGIMSKDILGIPTPVLFEDEEVWGVQKYDAYLSQKYGDYMTIPKQSGQRQHNFHYLDLNKPYREFEV